MLPLWPEHFANASNWFKKQARELFDPLKKYQHNMGQFSGVSLRFLPLQIWINKVDFFMGLILN